MIRPTGFLFLASLASLVVYTAACTSDSTTGTESNPPPKDPPASETADTGTGGATTPSGTVYSVSCSGEVSAPTSFRVDVSPKCIGGPPGSNCAPEDACEAQDVSFHYAPPAAKCIGVDVYEWNGSECVAHNTHGEGGMLKCTGKDCEKLFKSKEACEEHASTCLAK